MGTVPFKSTAQFGKWGEQVSARYLRKKGYTILACGFRTRHGELDIVALRHGIVVVVEVKTRTDFSFARGIEAVTPQKIQRMKAAAAAYLAMHQDERPVRFDCIEVIPGDCIDDPPRQLIHHENIYMDFS